MVSKHTASEVEEYLGSVPSFIDALSEPSADHAWAIMRDLELSETELPNREKALVGLGAAAAMQCPYCVHFHSEEAKLDGVTDEQLSEAIDVASTTRFFSTVLHGSQIDLESFKDETSDIVAHIESQQAAPSDD